MPNLEPEAVPLIANLEPEAIPLITNLEPEAVPLIANLEPEAVPLIANLEPEVHHFSRFQLSYTSRILIMSWSRDTPYMSWSCDLMIDTPFLQT